MEYFDVVHEKTAFDEFVLHTLNERYWLGAYYLLAKIILYHPARVHLVQPAGSCKWPS